MLHGGVDAGAISKPDPVFYRFLVNPTPFFMLRGRRIGRLNHRPQRDKGEVNLTPFSRRAMVEAKTQRFAGVRPAHRPTKSSAATDK
jgi:hypothetical protein